MAQIYLDLGNVSSLPYYLPEVTLAFTILLVLLIDFFSSSPKKTRLLSVLAFLGTLIALIHTLTLAKSGISSLFEGMISLDPFAGFFKVLILVTTLLIIPISYRDSETNRFDQAEYLGLLLSLALGGCVLASANNLLMVYLSLELVSLVSYVLAGYMKRDQRSSEASLKYVIYGGAASGAMIYGMSFLYGLSGSLEFGAIGEALSAMEATPASSLTLFVASLFCLVGFGYKIACVPFHMWCPDVYEGSPTPVTAYFSVVPKVAGFAALVRFFYGALSVPAGDGLSWMPIQQVEWPIILAAISCATMTLGNLVAIHQTSMKRLLAYSSIAHAGYLLMAVVVLTTKGISAVLFYLATYLIMNMGAFLVVILVKEATGSDHIDRFRGLGWQGGMASFLAVAMTIFLFSLTGIPPTAGFIGKVYLFAAVVDREWYWLAVVGVLNSVVSLYYYARIIKAMFFEWDAKGVEQEGSRQKPLLHMQPLHLGFLVLLVFLTVFLGIYWSPLAEGAHYSVAFLMRH